MVNKTTKSQTAKGRASSAAKLAASCRKTAVAKQTKAEATFNKLLDKLAARSVAGAEEPNERRSVCADLLDEAEDYFEAATYAYSQGWMLIGDWFLRLGNSNLTSFRNRGCL